MNLPTNIQFGNGKSISYRYDAAGVKLQKTVDYGTYQVITDYLNGYQYETKPVAQGGRGYAELLFFPMAEGYIKALYHPDLVNTASKAFQYVYIYKDHLGNNRLSYTFDKEHGSVKILEENHYYPFGLKHGTYNTTKRKVKYKEISTTKREVKQVPPEKIKYRYKYNGKEWQDELGLNTYDYQWRDYDPAIARFTNIDRFAEKYHSLTPYHFTANNPMFFREIAGDSLNISKIYEKNKDGTYKNPTQVKALEFFASTKIGKTFLGYFASKGQKIGKTVFKKDGKFHKKKIDLNFDANVSDKDNRSGETGIELDDNNRYQITISLDEGSNQYDVIESFTHEFFIHAFKYAKDITDNNKLDYSNIYSFIKKDYRKEQWQHVQEKLEARKNRSYFGKYGYPIMQMANKKYKQYENDNKVWSSMWAFIN